LSTDGGGHSAEELLVVFCPNGTADDSIQRSPSPPGLSANSHHRCSCSLHFSGLQINERPKSFQCEELGMAERLKVTAEIGYRAPAFGKI